MGRERRAVTGHEIGKELLAALGLEDFGGVRSIDIHASVSKPVTVTIEYTDRLNGVPAVFQNFELKKTDSHPSANMDLCYVCGNFLEHFDDARKYRNFINMHNQSVEVCEECQKKDEAKRGES